MIDVEEVLNACDLAKGPARNATKAYLEALVSNGDYDPDVLSIIADSFFDGYVACMKGTK